MCSLVKCFLLVGVGLALVDLNFADDSVIDKGFQRIEDVIILECVPGKYFWKGESPNEFFACIFPVEPNSKANAVHLRCNDGTVMCHTGIQPFQPCHCQEFQKEQSVDPVEKDITPKDKSIWSNLLQLFQKSDEKDDGRTKELSDVSHFQEINSFPNFNPENASRRDEIKTSLSTLPPRVKRIRGRRKFAKQLNADSNLSWSNAGCPGLFRQYVNSHMFQGVVRPPTSIESCKQGCLETRNCIGVDWNKLNNTEDSRRCFFIFPESTRYGLRPSMDYCCDHFRRTYCLSSPATHYTIAPTTIGPNAAIGAAFSNVSGSILDAAHGNSSTDANNSSSGMITTPTGQNFNYSEVMIMNQTNAVHPTETAQIPEVYNGTVHLYNQGYSQSPYMKRKDDARDKADSRSALEFLQGYLQLSKAHPQTTSLVDNIPDSGCPFAYEKFLDQSHPFGKNVTTADENSTPAECKTWCLMRSYCLAVDFNFETRSCYFHREINSELLMVNAGVNHYRKTNCAPPLKCWKTAASRITSSDDTRVTDGKTPMVECQGLCYVKQTVGSTNVIERGCLGNQTHNQGCFVDDAPGANYRTITCICDTNRCNGLSVEALVSQVLYLPLDGDFRDHSGIGHHGNIPPGYVPPTFTCLDRSVNCSALFTGNQCIAIPTGDSNLLKLVEVQNEQNQLVKVQKVTFVVYYKRVTSNIPTKQGVFGNSPSSSSNATWAIFSDNMTDTSTAGIITDNSELPTIEDFKYTKAADNNWHLSVLSYNGQNSPLPTLQYFVDGKEMLGNSRLEDGMISLNDNPVMIGCVEGLNFIGFIDEVRIFLSVLDRSDMKALLMMREANFW